MSTSMMLSLLLVVVVLCQGQSNGPYRQASSGLKPVSQQAPRYPAPKGLASPGAVPPGEPPLTAADLGADLPASPDALTTILDDEGRDLLLKFDDYLFNNLEQVYYRLSYAFKDAVKRTMNKCHCDAGSLEAPAGGKPKPPV